MRGCTWWSELTALLQESLDKPKFSSDDDERDINDDCDSLGICTNNDELDDKLKSDVRNDSDETPQVRNDSDDARYDEERLNEGERVRFELLNDDLNEGESNDNEL